VNSLFLRVEPACRQAGRDVFDFGAPFLFLLSVVEGFGEAKKKNKN